MASDIMPPNHEIKFTNHRVIEDEYSYRIDYTLGVDFNQTDSETARFVKLYQSMDPAHQMDLRIDIANALKRAVAAHFHQAEYWYQKRSVFGTLDAAIRQHKDRSKYQRRSSIPLPEHVAVSLALKFWATHIRPNDLGNTSVTQTRFDALALRYNLSVESPRSEGYDFLPNAWGGRFVRPAGWYSSSYALWLLQREENPKIQQRSSNWCRSNYLKALMGLTEAISGYGLEFTLVEYRDWQ